MSTRSQSPSPSDSDEFTFGFRMNFNPSPRNSENHNIETMTPTKVVEKEGRLIYSFDPPPGAEDRNEEEDYGLEFKEEPLGISTKYGFGYLRVEFGDRIGPGGRYEILRKVEWDMQASVWLARDTLNNRFVTIAALTGAKTNAVKDDIALEVNMMKKISSSEKGEVETHCLSLFDTFVQPGREEGDGEHLCMVTDLLGPMVSSLKDSMGRLTIPLLKKVLLDVLMGLNHLHGLGIAHTDLRADNIMMDLETGEHALDVEAFLRDNPSEMYPPELTEGKKYVRVAKSQPLPLPPITSWSSKSFIVAGTGLAQFVDRKVDEEIRNSPIDVRPPEVFLRIPWNEKVDIWTFGCMIFYLISGQKLFDPTLFDFATSCMLYQMLLYTGERFPLEICRATPVARFELDPDTGRLKREMPASTLNLYQRCKDSVAWDSADDLEGVVALMKKCLRLDPKDRPSAKELLQGPWLNSKA